MPKLSIKRISEFENRARKIQINLDGKIVATIKNGEQLELDVPTGKHTVQAKIDWCSSNLIEFEADTLSHIALELKSGDGPSLFRIIFRAKEYLKLTKMSP
ncbi:MAG: hypothetical protein ABJN95_16615 [Maribacter sp.]|uniref:hypothetical protein n=1 Tax=Maribacter sp. TaxID=1897614 RepID=UPI003297E397